MNCKKCGATLTGIERFCPICGQPVREDADHSVLEKPEKIREGAPLFQKNEAENDQVNYSSGKDTAVKKVNIVPFAIIGILIIVISLIVATDNEASAEVQKQVKNPLYGVWYVKDLEITNIDDSNPMSGLQAELYSFIFSNGAKLEFNENGSMIIGTEVNNFKIIDERTLETENAESVSRMEYEFSEDMQILRLIIDLIGRGQVNVYLSHVQEPLEEETAAEAVALQNEEQNMQDKENVMPDQENDIVLRETSVTFLSDMAEACIVGCDQSQSIITVRIYNYSNMEVMTFGLPTLIINGQSVGLDPYKNMPNHHVEIARDSYADINYYVDPAIFEYGGRLDGELHIMNPTIWDDTYSLDVIIEE